MSKLAVTSGKMSNKNENWMEYHLKSDPLLMARAKQLTTIEMDIFSLMLSKMSSTSWINDDGNELAPAFSFTSKELCEYFCVTSNQLSSFLKKPSKRLAERTFAFEGEKGDFSYTSLLTKIEYTRGTLLIKPNPELRQQYLIRSEDNDKKGAGFAKINNLVFRSLRNPNEKRVFEFLSRFQCSSYEWNYILVKKLQMMFGVLDKDGKPILKSYIAPSQFIMKIIKPALIGISKYEESKALFTLEMGRNGEVGYDLKEGKDGKKLKFLIKWHVKISEDDVEKQFENLNKYFEAYKLESSINVNSEKSQTLYDLLLSVLGDLNMSNEIIMFKEKHHQLISNQMAGNRDNVEILKDEFTSMLLKF